MFKLNNYCGFKGHFLPDIYMAVTTKDFIDQRDKIKKMSLAKLLCPITWFAGRDAIICFSNVGLTPKDGKYMICDINGVLDVEAPMQPFGWRSMPSARPEIAIDGHYNQVFIRYSPGRDKAYLHGTDMFGPPQEERGEQAEEEEKSLEETLVACPVPA